MVIYLFRLNTSLVQANTLIQKLILLFLLIVGMQKRNIQIIVADIISNIAFDGGTCKCANATVGDTEVINGTTYTVVDNSTIAGQITNGNVNLCTTLVTDMSGNGFGNIFSDGVSAGNLNMSSIDISFWDTSNVINMKFMFMIASAFNQDIGSWDTSSVTDMSLMFNAATAFNQDLIGWCVTNISSEPGGFGNSSALTRANYPVWGTCP